MKKETKILIAIGCVVALCTLTGICIGGFYVLNWIFTPSSEEILEEAFESKEVPEGIEDLQAIRESPIGSKDYSDNNYVTFKITKQEFDRSFNYLEEFDCHDISEDVILPVDSADERLEKWSNEHWLQELADEMQCFRCKEAEDCSGNFKLVYDQSDSKVYIFFETYRWG